MTPLILTVLATLVVALALAHEFGGALGGGVLAGYLLGTGLAGLSFLYQRHQLAYRPERVLHASVVCFLVKLGALLAGALTFRFVAAAGQRTDWRSFVVAYAAAVALVLPLATWTAVREQRQRNAARATVRVVGH